jgi:hypothetical protein
VSVVELSFNKPKFDELGFNELGFDELGFNELGFDIMSFDEMLLRQSPIGTYLVFLKRLPRLGWGANKGSIFIFVYFSHHSTYERIYIYTPF